MQLATARNIKTSRSWSRSMPVWSRVCNRISTNGSSPLNRSFHSTPKANFPILDNCLSHTHSIITGLHSVTGLPWIATLPLLAVLVRTVLVTPLSIGRHTRSERWLAAQPILQAWRHVLQRKIMEENGTRGPAVCSKLLVYELNTKRKTVYKSMGIKLWPALAPLAQLPIWLLIIETLRRMCGTHEGLLGLLSKSLKSSDDTDTVATISPSVIPIEDSLATEGGLWFTDLLAPDPMLILPFALSGTIFANIYYQERQNSLADITPGKWGTRFSRTMKLLALAIGPLTLHLPSAMLLYWLSSAASAMVHNVMMDKYMPRSRGVSPCKPKQYAYLMGLTTATKSK